MGAAASSRHCSQPRGLVAGLTGGVAPAGAERPEARRFIVTLQDSVADPASVAAEHSARYGPTSPSCTGTP